MGRLKFIPYILLITLLLTFPIWDRNAYHINLGVLVAIFGIIALGLNLLLGHTGQLSLGQAAFYGIGAYASAVFSTSFGLSFWLAMPASGLFSGLIGYLLGFASLRLKGHYLAMATLGFGIIISVVILEWTEVTGGPGGFPGIPPPKVGGFIFDTDTEYYYLVWFIFGLLFLLARNLVNSRIGRALSAIHENEMVASVIGVDVSSYKLKVFTLSAIYAGIAGSLFAHFSRMIGPASFSFEVSLTLVCMVLVGGLGRVWGSLIGVVALLLMPEALRYIAAFSFIPEGVRMALTDYTYHLIAYGLLLVTFVIFLPTGIAGGLERIWRRGWAFLR